MFDTLETGNRLSADEFDHRELELRRALLAEQRGLAARDYPLLILVSGLEGSGKGALVQRLNEWMDPRGIETITYWDHSDEDESHPLFWRYWRRLPPDGHTGIFLGSWYHRAATTALALGLRKKEVAHHCRQIEQFERTLIDDGALVVKLWLQVSAKVRRKRLQENLPPGVDITALTSQPYDLHGDYRKILRYSEYIVSRTHADHSPWHLIDADDRRYRDITAGQIIFDAMRTRALQQPRPSPVTPALIRSRARQLSDKKLAEVDLDQSLDRERYRKQLDKYRDRLRTLAWQSYLQKRSLVAVFEGWDAGGKGSVIRRATRAMDPRMYRVVQTAAPTDEERQHHYLWRFWRKLERDGRATLYDRSWYGRVLVERVEQLTAPETWRRAYEEINEFEAQLAAHGSIVVKFWLHISPQEQLRRFEEREEIPHKRHKITADDWRNRSKWNEYEAAVNEMVARTDKVHAPWHLVPAQDKLYARIQVLKQLCQALQRALAD